VQQFLMDTHTATENSRMNPAPTVNTTSRRVGRTSHHVVTGVAVHSLGADEYCWVYLASSDESSRYAELPGDDECYPSKDAALIAAYLAFRKRLRKGAT
jgi:hypothetical protein